MPKKKHDPNVPVLDAPPPTETAARISVLERRLQNPLGEPSAPVRLKDDTLHPRWFNSSSRPDNIWRAKELGWEGVRPDDIVDLSQIGTHMLSPDGFVARGERGQEVLMAMPKKIFDKIQWAKSKKNLEMMKDTDGEKHRMLNAAAKKFGGTAAEYMNERVGPVGRVTDNYERIEQVEGAEAED
jgi:hypothetical protein